VPKAVTAWKTSLKNGGKPKLADGIADPSTHADLFTEGWEATLAREKSVRGAVNGGAGAVAEEEESEEE
jgi:hypothetical protein